MIKLGEIKDIKIGKVRAWGYDIKQICLCKENGNYLLTGLCWDGEKAHGWCTLTSDKSLQAVRRYARSILN